MLILLMAVMVVGCQTVPVGWRTTDVSNVVYVSDAVKALAESSITPTSEAFLVVARMGGSAYVTSMSLGEDKDTASSKASSVIKEAEKGLAIDVKTYIRSLCPKTVLTDAEIYVGIIKAGAELVLADQGASLKSMGYDDLIETTSLCI